MKLIGTKKKGVRKELERLKKQHQKNKQLKLKKTVSSGGMLHLVLKDYIFVLLFVPAW